LVTIKSTGSHCVLSTRGTVGRHFDMIFFLNINSHEANIVGKENILATTEEIPFKLLGAKIGLLGSYKLIEKHLSFEFGSALQISDKFEIESKFNDYILEAYETFTAKDACQTSRLNVMGIVGISTEFQSFKISLQYEYGFTNVLNKLTGNEIN
jgi:hypothetical protein